MNNSELQSPTGYQLRRAELFAFDGDGNRIKHRPRGEYEIPIHETRPTPNQTHGYEQRERMVKALRSLSEAERAVWWERHYETDGLLWKQLQFTAAQWEDAREMGWLYVRTSKRGRIVAVKQFPRTLTLPEIGARLGITPEAVHRLLSVGARKLKAALR